MTMAACGSRETELCANGENFSYLYPTHGPDCSMSKKGKGSRSQSVPGHPYITWFLAVKTGDSPAVGSKMTPTRQRPQGLARSLAKHHKALVAAVRSDSRSLSPIPTPAMLPLSPTPLSRDSHSPAGSISSEDADLRPTKADIQHMLGQ